MFRLAALVSFVTFASSVVNAQSPVYGQCGGQNWNGATTCAAGSVCTFSNPYYSQCLPGSASSPTGPTSTISSSASQSSSASHSSSSASSVSSTSSTPSQTPVAGNPFTGYSIFLSPFYAAEVAAAAGNITDSTLAAKAASVAQIPTFTWFDQVAKVPTLGTYLASASALGKSSGTKQLVQIVVYDLPDRDCAAAASNGEFSIANNGQANYFNYIDQLVAQIKQYPDVRVVAVIEPDSLANLVTNLNVAKCANAQTTYLACVNYAIEQLSTVGVYMYLDAGHAGWLGWSSNLSPAAQLFSTVYKNAGSSSFVRGLATNVANYNSLTTNSPDPITQGDACYDEQLYINALAPLLKQQGFNAQFIVDQGRSGVQNIRQQWGDWCNVKGAGFGTRPTTNTGSALIDSIVWVKPGGECDGTSNQSSPRYDYHCGQSDAAQPAPEAGTWFQAYFQTLVSNANPPL
ncbi:glycoside hydrolase family 6 protein [Artomyces pyxidatus]|uniref:Glycoside hydrolase family 6 protein n=1 Tax=Artomyces pyxidatus TaxID=48021 RepID=A0ACB8T942_9AGAM|nr:glycoside hydrolase family 6 protein [Artomyces pyxidatus]